ncbi:Aldehyde dehydrogenase family 3 member H1 [Linum perenne]
MAATGDENLNKTVFDEVAAKQLVDELRAGFDSGTTRSYHWRVTQLKNILNMCDESEKEVIEALRQDLAKPEHESTLYEVTFMNYYYYLFVCRDFSSCLLRPAKTSVTTFPSSAEIVSEPFGVVLIISAWNYPFLLSIDPVIGAIAAGNAVVLKPSELAPASSSLLAKLFAKYLDSSSIKVVEGAIAETSALLEQKWDKIMYTGNSRVGRIVMAAAAKHLTPVIMELGGKCPVVVDSDINLQVAVRRIIVGKWGCNNGQACISPDYILTTKDYAPKLVDALKTELEAFYGKNQLESKDLSRIVNSNHFSRLSKLLDDEKVSGKIVYGGERDEVNLRIAPTVLLDIPRDSLIMNEEIFGPLLPVLTLNNIDESFDVINSGTKPLAAYIFTNNNKLKEKFVMSVSTGGIVVNDTTIHLAVHTLPFGGVGESGMGSYHGKFSFDAFSHKKAVVYRSFVADASLRYPPYTSFKLKLMKALMSGSFPDVLRALLGGSKI